MATGTHQPGLQPPAMHRPQGGVDMCSGLVGVREHEQPSGQWCWCGCAPRVPVLVGQCCAALLREAGREQQLPGAAEAKQALPAHLGKVLGVSEHKAGQSPWVWMPSPGQGWAGQAMWDLAVSPGQVQLPRPCDMGRMSRTLFPCGWPWLPEGSPASGAGGAGWPWTGEVERGSVAAPCPPGSHCPSSPALGVPLSILTPCLMPCPRPDAVLTSLTHTPASTVCLITMSVSGHWGAVGLHPDRQVPAFPGEWEGGVGE